MTAQGPHTTPPSSLNAAPEATLRTLLADAHDRGDRCLLHELHHYGRAIEALEALVAERDEALNLAKDLIGYSALRSKVRTREDASEYVEAERLIAIYDALRGTE